MDRITERFLLIAVLMLTFTASATAEPEAPELAAVAPDWWCNQLPRDANLLFERVDLETDWFQVHRVEEGVFALI